MNLKKLKEGEKKDLNNQDSIKDCKEVCKMVTQKSIRKWLNTIGIVFIIAGTIGIYFQVIWLPFVGLVVAFITLANPKKLAKRIQKILR